MLIGQDIWQRVFTARSPGVAKWGGTTAALYCVLYGVAGAVIGMAASTFLPAVKAKDDVYAQIAETILPVGISGIVLAAAVAAMMSTASGALIATATVAKTDVKPLLLRLIRRDAPQERDGADDVHSDRLYVVMLGIAVVVIAALLNDVVSALTVAYDILVGGLLVAILGGFLWKRATGTGALWSMGVGTVVTLGTMFAVGDVLANEPIYYGLAASLVAYVVASLLSPRTPAPVLQVWDDRLAGRAAATEPVAS
jgi:SSS family solute:Na+ symporter